MAPRNQPEIARAKSAAINPTVIVTTSSAPSNLGGAGRGRSNHLHPYPMTKARSKPTAVVTFRIPHLLDHLPNPHRQRHSQCAGRSARLRPDVRASSPVPAMHQQGRAVLAVERQTPAWLLRLPGRAQMKAQSSCVAIFRWTVMRGMSATHHSTTLTSILPSSFEPCCTVSPGWR